jgi:hypothetical protein
MGMGDSLVSRRDLLVMITMRVTPFLFIAFILFSSVVPHLMLSGRCCSRYRGIYSSFILIDLFPNGSFWMDPSFFGKTCSDDE